MVGHSKWLQVQHIKGPFEVERRAASRKLVKEITVPVQIGGGGLSGNSRLRPVVETALTQIMPQENSKSAVKKGTGELGVRSDAEARKEERESPGIAAANDLKNRLAADQRFILSQNPGSLPTAGSVPSRFHPKRVPTVPRRVPTKPTSSEAILSWLEA